jgi:hypothetical protein
MITGHYNLYLDGELVGSADNSITERGAMVILRYLAGQTGNYAGAIAVGNSQVLSARSDTKLFFELARAVVDVAAPDFINSRVVFKATIPLAVSGLVYELGLYPYLQAPASEYASRLITGFEPSSEPFDLGTPNTVNFRIGTESLGLTAAAGTSVAPVLSSTRDDFSGFAPDDTFSLSYFINDANTASIRVSARTDATNYYSYVITPATTAGYFVSEFSKSEFVATGAPDWSQIVDWQFTVTAGSGGSTAVQLDGLRINDNTEYIDYALVSRAVLADPITKIPGQQLDVEYVLDFNI